MEAPTLLCRSAIFSLLVFLLVNHNIWSVHRRSQEVKKVSDRAKSVGLALFYIFLEWCFFPYENPFNYRMPSARLSLSCFLCCCFKCFRGFGFVRFLSLFFFFLSSFYIFSVSFLFSCNSFVLAKSALWSKLCRVLECTHISLLLKYSVICFRPLQPSSNTDFLSEMCSPQRINHLISLNFFLSYCCLLSYG